MNYVTAEEQLTATAIETRSRIQFATNDEPLTRDIVSKAGSPKANKANVISTAPLNELSKET